MNLTIELTKEEEVRLWAAAERSGTDVQECARRLLAASLPPAGRRPDPTLELLAAWDAEDATDDPEEKARRARDWAELRKGLEDAPLALRRQGP